MLPLCDHPACLETGNPPQANFHKRFPEFENNYSVAAGAFEPQTISALRTLQEVQEKLLACLKMAFNNSGGLRPRDVPKSLRVAILLVRALSPHMTPPNLLLSSQYLRSASQQTAKWQNETSCVFAPCPRTDCDEGDGPRPRVHLLSRGRHLRRWGGAGHVHPRGARERTDGQRM